VDVLGRYLSTLWQRPCADLWEESSDKIHVSTLVAIFGGLRSAAALLRHTSAQQEQLLHLQSTLPPTATTQRVSLQTLAERFEVAASEIRQVVLERGVTRDGALAKHLSVKPRHSQSSNNVASSSLLDESRSAPASLNNLAQDSLCAADEDPLCEEVDGALIQRRRAVRHARAQRSGHAAHRGAHRSAAQVPGRRASIRQGQLLWRRSLGEPDRLSWLVLCHSW